MIKYSASMDPNKFGASPKDKTAPQVPVYAEAVGKVAEPSRLCPEQRRDAAATLGASHWVCLRSCSATDNFGIHRKVCGVGRKSFMRSAIWLVLGHS